MLTTHPLHHRPFVPLAAGIAALLAVPSLQAASQSWDGGSTTNGNWNNAQNWVGDNPPPGATSGSTNTDNATFDAVIANGWGTQATPVVIDSPTQNIGGIKFINKSTTGDYFIGTTGGNPLRLSGGGSISLTFDPAIPSTYVNTETVNAPLVLLGTTYGFSNTSNNAILRIGGSISGTTGTSLSFTKRGAPWGSDITYAIQESTDLGIGDAWAEVTGGTYTNNSTTISYTFTPGTPPKDFFRLRVTQTTP